MIKWFKNIFNSNKTSNLDKTSDKAILRRTINLNRKEIVDYFRQHGKLSKSDFYAIRHANGIEVFYPKHDGNIVRDNSFVLNEQNPTHSVGQFEISLDKNMRVLIETTTERLLRQAYEREVKERRMQITEQLRDKLRADPELIQDKEQFCDACQMFFDKTKKRSTWSNAERNIVLNPRVISPVEIPVNYPKCNK